MKPKNQRGFKDVSKKPKDVLILGFFRKVYILIDYVARYRKFPKSIELTDDKEVVRINGSLCGFKSKNYAPYEHIEEVSDEDWEKYFSKRFGKRN